MKQEIPKNRTKAYWDSKVPDPCQNKKVIWGDRCQLFGKVSILFLLNIVISHGDKVSWIITIVGLPLIFVCLEWVFRCSYLRRQDETITIKLRFSDIGYLYRESDYDAVRKLYPQEMDVRRFHLFYRLDDKKHILSRRKCLRCIGTREKFEALEHLIHMKETAVLRKESRMFKVTYIKSNKELERIEKEEGETYPIHCDYEELLERINIMF